MIESKQILYSLAAGIIAGVIASIILLVRFSGVFDEFMYEVIYRQLLSAGLPEEKVLEIANTSIQEIKWIHWLIPIGPIINMLFLGAILGVFLDFLIKRLSLKPYIASILAGLILIFLLQLIPMLIISKLYAPWLIELLDKYIGIATILAPSIIYTIILILFNTIEGPWTKWGEAKPETY